MNWYKIAQLTQELQNTYATLIQEFINENKNIMYDKVITDQQWAVGACGTVSRDLVKFFIRKGIEAKVLGCTGFIPELPEDAHTDWLSFKGEGQKYLWHAVVETDNAIIDLTGGQYGKVFSGVQIKPKEEYLQNWESNKPHHGRY
jgi:hypothetical protein